MAWKGRTVAQSDFTQLIKALDNSRIQTENNALYQVLLQLVQAAQKNKDIVVTDITDINASINNSNTTINTITADLTAILASFFLTVTDQTSLFPNSRRLVAGTNITLDLTTPGQEIINASGSGGETLSPFLLMGA